MKWKEGYKNQVIEGFIIQTPITPIETIVTPLITLRHDGRLTIKDFYAWDGASGPTFDKEIDLKLFKIKLTDTTVPTCVHDAFAQLMRTEMLDRKWLPYVNEFFDYQLKKRGMTWLRRRIWRRGLWLTDGSFADPENAKKEYESF
tara:strand:- start:538 stop:972 length:435 start_codon:yes stop_codon:yes gene_type:complete